MKRVLNVIYDERFDGPPNEVLQLAPVLRRRGIDIVVAIPKGDPFFRDRLKQEKIEVVESHLVRLRHSVNPVLHARFLTRFWPNVMMLRRLIRAHHIEVVHTIGLIHLQAPIAAYLERVPLVWHLDDVNPRPMLRAALVPWVRRLADVVAITSRAVDQHYFPDHSGPNDRMHVLYPPVDTEKFNPTVDAGSVRADLGIPKDVPVIGSVGNLSPGKGFEFFLEAAAQIKRRFPAAKFLIVGAVLENRKQYFKALLERRRKLGLTNDALFLGQRQDIPQLMAAMTIAVHASEEESGPMVVMEASASGVPVVATDVGGPRELLEDGVTGILVEPRSPAQIADAVLYLLENPAIADHMGKCGVQRMRERFSLDTAADARVRAYQAAIKSHQIRERYNVHPWN
jgi:glycosyltransferase involved in cell wall biosynthesis